MVEVDVESLEVKRALGLENLQQFLVSREIDRRADASIRTFIVRVVSYASCMHDHPKGLACIALQLPHSITPYPPDFSSMGGGVFPDGAVPGASYS